MILDALQKCLMDARKEMYTARDANDSMAATKWYKVVIRIQEIIAIVED